MVNWFLSLVILLVVDANNIDQDFGAKFQFSISLDSLHFPLCVDLALGICFQVKNIQVSLGLKNLFRNLKGYIATNRFKKLTTTKNPEIA
jgi:hypothetical protein